MPRYRPDRPGTEWLDPRTGLRWRTVDRSHVEPVYRPGEDLPRPLRPRSRGYKVTADDVVLAGGAGLAAAFSSEAALWYEAAKLAREFNRQVDRGEAVVDKVAEWVKSRVGGGSVPGVAGSAGEFLPRLPRAFRVPASEQGRLGDRRARSFQVPADDDVRRRPVRIPLGFTMGMQTYPGKVPPGYRPGLGPGGTRSRARGGIRGPIRYEYS